MIDAHERLDFYVYLHRRASDGLVFYVGKGTGPRAWVWQNRNSYWTNTKNKHGLEVEIALCGLSEPEAFAHEKGLIARLADEGHPLTNLTTGGEGMSGYIYPDDHRRNLSSASKGRVRSEAEIEKWRASRAGWKHSKETKAKLSAIGTGTKRGPLSDEVREKISKANTGKRHSEETKSKISANRSGLAANPDDVAKRIKSRMENGYRHSAETRAKIGEANALALKGKPMLDYVKEMLVRHNTKQEPILCVETGQVFSTAKQAQDWCVAQGFVCATGGRIRRVCNGHGKSCYGHTWKFFAHKEECVSS